MTLSRFEDDGSAISDHIADQCKLLRQGDVIEMSHLPLVGQEGRIELSCPFGAAIITQTCDLVQANKKFAVVAPVVVLDKGQAGLAKQGKMPQYVHLSHLEQEQFVDLSHCATLTKSALVAYRVMGHGVNPEDNEAVSQFAARIGRRFSRFPFPDEVQPWFRPLQIEVAKMHGKNSPLGEVLRRLVDLRIESNDWSQPAMELTIHVVTPALELPHPDDIDPDDFPFELDRELRTNGALRLSAAEIASRIEAGTQLTQSEKYVLWDALAQAIAELCQLPSAEDRLPVLNAVSQVTGRLWSEDEFSLYHYRRSESLDLDYLSPSIMV